VARIITTDDELMIDRPRRYSELQKAFMTAKFRKIMMRRDQIEPATGAYASALMLVPYKDRIDKFFKTHGEDSYVRMREEQSTE
jgi:hypothetical protein